MTEKKTVQRNVVNSVIQRMTILLLALSAAQVFAQSQIEGFQAGPEPLRKEVSFETEDGWTIYATYYVPRDVGQTPVPGLVVLSEPDTNPRFLGGNISGGVGRNGMAALAIDMRGTNASFGDKDYQFFNQEERDAMQLDIRAAIKFLSSQKEVDSKRIAIFGPSVTVDYVAREAAHNLTQVKALVLSTGWLTDKGRESLKFRKDLPVLAIVSLDQSRIIQERSAEPFFLSEDKGSRLMFVVDRGASIFNRPGQPIERVTEWLQNNLLALGTQSEVSFKTEDGLTLKGTLYKPAGLDRADTAPGVVFVHGANHDATTWYHLAREVTKTGLAALIFDQRGFMKSGPEGRANSRDHSTMQLDIKAAANFLASQPWVDPNQLAYVTATSRTTPTLLAAYGDARIKTLVGLSFYGGNEETNRAAAGLDIPMFLIASINDMNADGGSLEEGTREVYRLSNNKETELLMYDDAGRGSAMLKYKPELTGMIVRWLNDKLAR
jgi:dienelactone hydrolase